MSAAMPWWRGPGDWALAADQGLEPFDYAEGMENDSIEVAEPDNLVPAERNVENWRAYHCRAQLHFSAVVPVVSCWCDYRAVSDGLCWLSGLANVAPVDSRAAWSEAIGIQKFESGVSHVDEGVAAIPVFVAVAERSEQGEWVTLHADPALEGLKVVDDDAVLVGDSAEHSRARRTAAPISIVALIDEDRELRSRAFGDARPTVERELVNQMIEGRTDRPGDFADVVGPVIEGWCAHDANHERQQAIRILLGHDAIRIGISKEVADGLLKRIELFFAPFQSCATTIEIGSRHALPLGADSRETETQRTDGVHARPIVARETPTRAA